MNGMSQETIEKLLAAAIESLASAGFAGYDPRDVAKSTQIDLADVLERAGTPEAVLAELARHLDRKMVEVAPSGEEDLSVRERLFELMMQRLDAMAPFKDGLRRLAREKPGAPGLTLQTLCNLDRTAGWMLAAAGAGGAGLESSVRRIALVQAYGRVVRVWLDDDSPDLAATMSELDKRLAQLEDWASGVERLRRFGGRRRSSRPGSSSTSEDAPGDDGADGFPGAQPGNEAPA